ncbi:MAG: tRNA 2-thiouridine(34) synthase MnmA [Thermoanaerobacterales bacterium]|nr:tRNA 2-thiouridine(34) synthase MnmA [Thermoanaerobacterales bacterium]
MSASRGIVAVALSGGVDSSMTALLLREQGFWVFAVTMPTTPTVAARAGKVAEHLGLKHYVADEIGPLFVRDVVDYFCSAYRDGLTPNPCIACNRRIKYGALMEYALRLGADYFATGHYACVRRTAGGARELWRGLDRAKDQSYVLYHLSQERLARIMLPLGGRRKEDVRRDALRRGIPFIREESQEICFIPQDDYRTFLRTRLEPGAAAPGPIRTVDGRVVGEHRGLPFYTIGQRRGLRVALGYPVYVLGFVREENALIVGPADALRQREMAVGEVHFIAGCPPAQEFSAEVQIRYHARPARAQVFTAGGTTEARVLFCEPQTAITPGQAAVFYEGDKVLGGGLIKAAG